MHPALTRTDHRPWPLPDRPWVLRQSWTDLLFAHWPVPVESLRPLIPPQLEVQELDGSAWLGLVPFRMTGVAPRFTPALPGLSEFPELNVRTYVERDGKPGVWFFSLDATSPLAVMTARELFHLPYFRAEMAVITDGGRVRYASKRGSAGLLASYGPMSPIREAIAGTLEQWLTERYCLYAAARDGGVWRCDIHHHPWPLQDAEAVIERNTMFDAQGLVASGPPAVLHFAKRLDVVTWAPVRVA